MRTVRRLMINPSLSGAGNSRNGYGRKRSTIQSICSIAGSEKQQHHRNDLNQTYQP